MPTHLLNKIQLPGRELVLATSPDFDFYSIRKITRLTVETTSENLINVVLVGAYEKAGLKKPGCVTMLFTNVQVLRFPEATPFLAIAEIEVEDLRANQLEDIRYCMKSYGMNDFEIASKNIEIIEFIQAD